MASGPVTSAVPPPVTCCTESMLGLLNIAPEPDIQQLLRVSAALTVILNNKCFEGLMAVVSSTDA